MFDSFLKILAMALPARLFKNALTDGNLFSKLARFQRLGQF
jgi:hypothetical protein